MMIFQYLIAILIGVLAGTISGLIPGIHINLIAIILVSISGFFLNFTSSIILVIFIISMAITHTFVDFIPSIFLGAPDSDTALAVLPGHRLLLKKQAYHAIIYTLYGSIIAIPLLLLIIPIMFLFLPLINNFLPKIIPLLLILATVLTIKKEQNKLFAIIIFLLSGILGYITLNSSVNQPLLPLLTGLFGGSNLIISMIRKTKIPKQQFTKIKNIKLTQKQFLRSSLISGIFSPICSFLPGLGSSHAAVLSSAVFKKKQLKEEEFLFIVGIINTLVMSTSFFTLHLIGKTRTGAAVAINNILPNLNSKYLIIIFITIIIASFLATIITIYFAKMFSKIISEINYIFLAITTLIIIFIIVLIISKILGIFIFLTSSLMGLTAILTKIKRINLMGCLIIPVIIFYIL